MAVKTTTDQKLKDALKKIEELNSIIDKNEIELKKLKKELEGSIRVSQTRINTYSEQVNYFLEENKVLAKRLSESIHIDSERVKYSTNNICMALFAMDQISCVQIAKSVYATVCQRAIEKRDEATREANFQKKIKSTLNMTSEECISEMIPFERQPYQKK